MKFSTRILEVGPNPRKDPALQEASRLLREGMLVAFPTETVYGLGGDAARSEVIDKIFEAKNRPSDNPLIVHLDRAERVQDYCSQTHPSLEILSKTFWPGPLTIVLPANHAVRQTVCRGLKTVALRVPNHEIARELIRQTDAGLAAPSANISGRPSPTTAQHVFQDMNGRIPLILDGGPCLVGIESTVLDLSEELPVILRPGMITQQDLEEVLGFPVLLAQKNEALRRSPGTRYRHYSPNAPVYLLGPSISDEVFQKLVQFLAVKGEVGYLGDRPPGSCIHIQVELDKLAAQLYSGLRDLDTSQACGIIVDGLKEQDTGISVMDRLKKAASHYFESDHEALQFLSSPTSDQE